MLYDNLGMRHGRRVASLHEQERTTDNAARQESPVSQSGAKDTPTTPASAAPAPWTYKLAAKFPNGGYGLDKQECINQLLEAYLLLEQIVHQQQAWARKVNRNALLPDALAAEFDAIEAVYVAHTGNA